MLPLILDFLRRWRWIVALYVVFTGFEAGAGVPLAFTVGAMICLVFDGQLGVFRSVRPLPVTRRAQAAAWWIIGVPLPSLLALLPAIVGTAIHAHFVRPPAEPWFVLGANTVVGLGLASVCFLLATLLPTRQPTGILESLGHAVIGLCWGILFPGSMILLQFLPKTLSATQPWHLAVASAVPVLVLLSLLAAPEMLSRRSSPIVASTRQQAGKGLTTAGGVTGITFYLLNFGGRMVVLLLAMAAVQILFLHFIFGHAAGKGAPFQIQIVMMSLLFGVVTSDLAGVRALRALPLTTRQLAALILSLPAIAGLTAGLIVVLFYPGGHPDLLPIVRLLLVALTVAGFGALTLALVLQITSGFRLVIMMALGVVPAALSEIGFGYPFVLVAVDCLAGACGYVLVLRGLRHSAFYQPKTFFGAVAGQPFGVR